MTTKNKDENLGTPSVEATVRLFIAALKKKKGKKETNLPLTSLESSSDYFKALAKMASPTVVESGLRVQALTSLAMPKV